MDGSLKFCFVPIRSKVFRIFVPSPVTHTHTIPVRVKATVREGHGKLQPNISVPSFFVQNVLLQPCSSVHKLNNTEIPIQLVILAHVHAQHVTFHDMKSEIRKNPIKVSSPSSSMYAMWHLLGFTSNEVCRTHSSIV